MVVGCVSCDWSNDVPKHATAVRSRYKCHRCSCPITSVSVFSWAEWIEQYADQLEARRRQGRIGTRRQSADESDRDISAAGIGAELAACVILAPWRMSEWMKATETSKPNSGCDFPATWFSDGRPIEVKYTSHRGHLLVRPARNTPGPMLRKYIDDSLYVLLTGVPYTYTALGWAGRSDLLRRGRCNPIPVRGRQRECWGIHANELNPIESLFPLLARRRGKGSSGLLNVPSPK